VSARQTSAVFTTMANISQKNKLLSLWEIKTLVYDHQIYDTDNKTLWHWPQVIRSILIVESCLKYSDLESIGGFGESVQEKERRKITGQ